MNNSSDLIRKGTKTLICRRPGGYPSLGRMIGRSRRTRKTGIFHPSHDSNGDRTDGSRSMGTEVAMICQMKGAGQDRQGRTLSGFKSLYIWSSSSHPHSGGQADTKAQGGYGMPRTAGSTSWSEVDTLYTLSIKD